MLFFFQKKTRKPLHKAFFRLSFLVGFVIRDGMALPL